MTPLNQEQPPEPKSESSGPFSNSLDSLRQAGCKTVNRYLPNYDRGSDQAEVFGITESQFDRAFDLEWIRRGRPENALVVSLYQENERLRADLNRVGLCIDSACRGVSHHNEPGSLKSRLDMVRRLSCAIQAGSNKAYDDEDGFFFAA